MEGAQGRLDALSAQYDVVEANLRRAIEFASNWYLAFMAGSPKVRRQMNQAIFERINVHEDRQITSTLAEPFGTLLGDETQRIVADPSEISQTNSDTDLNADWSAIADSWSAEDRRELVGAGTTNPHDNARRGGLRVNYMVGAEGGRRGWTLWDGFQTLPNT